MTVTRSASAAETARSILSSPASIDLVVADVAHPTSDDPQLKMVDTDGVPTFSCRIGSTLSRAAADGHACLLTVSSDIGASGSPEREATLALAGILRRTGFDRCPCCGELRNVVVVDVAQVRLHVAGERVDVAVSAFGDGALALNRGFLQRWRDHANSAHAQELREAVAQRRGRPAQAVVAASLSALSADGLVIDWIEPDGGRRLQLTFPRRARSATDLGALLREQIHAGLC